MKPLEIPWSKQNGISISANGEVRWDRSSHSPNMPSVILPTGSRNSERPPDQDPVDHSDQISNKSSSINGEKPDEKNEKSDESIEEILKKFSHLSSLPSVINGLDVLNGSLTESYAQLPGEENKDVTPTKVAVEEESGGVNGSAYTFQNPITPRVK